MLSDFQREVIGLVTSLPGAAHFALSGGAALIHRGIVARPTDDLDFFAEFNDIDAETIPGLVSSVRRAAESRGWTVTAAHETASFARLELGSSAAITRLDLAADARLFPATEHHGVVVLTIDELAADKTLALFGRAQPRDFQDVAALEAQLGWPRLCELAAAKDSGFSVARLLEAVATFEQLAPQAFGDRASYQRLQQTVEEWRDELPMLRREQNSREQNPPGLQR